MTPEPVSRRSEAEALEAAEDFRAEIVVDAFTAPDADWNTILDSLRARIGSLVEERDRAIALFKAKHEDWMSCRRELDDVRNRARRQQEIFDLQLAKLYQDLKRKS